MQAVDEWLWGVAGWMVWCRDIIECHQHRNGSWDHVCKLSDQEGASRWWRGGVQAQSLEARPGLLELRWNWCLQYKMKLVNLGLLYTNSTTLKSIMNLIGRQWRVTIIVGVRSLVLEPFRSLAAVFYTNFRGAETPGRSQCQRELQ